MIIRSKQAVPAVPPFAMPTWIRPIIGAGDYSTVLAGGWTRTQQFDVVTRWLTAVLLTCMSEDAIIEQAYDRNKAASCV